MFSEHAHGHPFDEDTGKVKWYDRDDHMMAVSKHSSLCNVAMVVDIDGDEPGDVRRQVFLNGELAWEWACDAKRPEVPPEILAQTDDEARGLREAKATALAKLTDVEKRALGVEP